MHTSATVRECVCVLYTYYERRACSSDTMKWLNSNKTVLYIVHSFHVDNNHFQFFNFTSVKCSMLRLFYFMCKVRGWDTHRYSLQFFLFFLWNSTDDFKVFFYFLFICQSIVFMYARRHKYFNLLKLLENEAYSIDTCVLERTVLLLALIRVKDIALNEFKVKLLFGKLGSGEFYDSASPFLFVCLFDCMSMRYFLFCCESGSDGGGAGDDNGFVLYRFPKGSWLCDFYSVGWHDCYMFSFVLFFDLVHACWWQHDFASYVAVIDAPLPSPVITVSFGHSIVCLIFDLSSGTLRYYRTLNHTNEHVRLVKCADTLCEKWSHIVDESKHILLYVRLYVGHRVRPVVIFNSL